MGTTTQVKTTRVENLGEYCDRCNARGVVEATLIEGGKLVFCGHHANKYGPALLKSLRSVRVDSEFSWSMLAADKPDQS